MSSDARQMIEVIVDAKGESTVQTRGFAGSSCRQASAFLENALGERTAERLTGEYHQQPSEARDRLTQQG